MGRDVLVYDVSRVPIIVERSFIMYDTCLYTAHDYLRLVDCSSRHVEYFFLYSENYFGMVNMLQLYSLILMFLVYNKIIGFVTRRYQDVNFCGPSIKASWSSHLQYPMYDSLRVSPHKTTL